MDVKARVSSGDELLNEKFTIPSIITTPNPIDFNTYTKPGIFYIGSHTENSTNDANFINGGPIKFWGTLIVSGSRPDGTPFQIFIEDSRCRIYHRHVALNKSTETNYVWTDWAIINDEKSVLNKAFPIGFSYLSTNGSDSLVPSFGTWKVVAYGTIGNTKPFEPSPPIYKITRTA